MHKLTCLMISAFFKGLRGLEGGYLFIEGLVSYWVSVPNNLIMLYQ